MEEKKITVEKLQRDWKTFKFYKNIIIGAISGIIFGGSTMLGVWEWYSKPQINNIVEMKLADLAEEEKQDKQSRWEITGKLMSIDGDLVPYEIMEMSVQVDSIISSMERFKEEYQPWLDTWMGRTILVRYLDDQGQEWMNWRDNRGHPIVEYIDGCPWIVYSQQRIFPLPCNN